MIHTSHLNMVWVFGAECPVRIWGLFAASLALHIWDYMPVKVAIVIAATFGSCTAMLTLVDGSKVAAMLGKDLLDFH